MKTLTNLLVLFFVLIFSTSFAQTALKGKVVDEKGHGLPGANVSLKGSYDGATADAEGNFQFKTSEKGEQVLNCSFVGYETYNHRVMMKSGLV
jgi:CarboxypepD_reg-like domain